MNGRELFGFVRRGTMGSYCSRLSSPGIKEEVPFMGGDGLM